MPILGTGNILDAIVALQIKLHRQRPHLAFGVKPPADSAVSADVLYLYLEGNTICYTIKTHMGEMSRGKIVKDDSWLIRDGDKLEATHYENLRAAWQSKHAAISEDSKLALLEIIIKREHRELLEQQNQFPIHKTEGLLGPTIDTSDLKPHVDLMLRRVALAGIPFEEKSADTGLTNAQRSLRINGLLSLAVILADNLLNEDKRDLSIASVEAFLSPIQRHGQEQDVNMLELIINLLRVDVVDDASVQLARDVIAFIEVFKKETNGILMSLIKPFLGKDSLTDIKAISAIAGDLEKAIWAYKAGKPILPQPIRPPILKAPIQAASPPRAAQREPAHLAASSDMTIVEEAKTVALPLAPAPETALETKQLEQNLRETLRQRKNQLALELAQVSSSLAQQAAENKNAPKKQDLEYLSELAHEFLQASSRDAKHSYTHQSLSDLMLKPAFAALFPSHLQSFQEQVRQYHPMKTAIDILIAMLTLALNNPDLPIQRREALIPQLNALLQERAERDFLKSHKGHMPAAPVELWQLIWNNFRQLIQVVGAHAQKTKHGEQKALAETYYQQQARHAQLEIDVQNATQALALEIKISATEKLNRLKTIEKEYQRLAAEGRRVLGHISVLAADHGFWQRFHDNYAKYRYIQKKLDPLKAKLDALMKKAEALEKDSATLVWDEEERAAIQDQITSVQDKLARHQDDLKKASQESHGKIEHNRQLCQQQEEKLSLDWASDATKNIVDSDNAARASLVNKLIENLDRYFEDRKPRFSFYEKLSRLPQLFFSSYKTDAQERREYYENGLMLALRQFKDHGNNLITVRSLINHGINRFKPRTTPRQNPEEYKKTLRYNLEQAQELIDNYLEQQGEVAQKAVASISEKRSKDRPTLL